MATDTSAIQTQIVREAPEIEAYKRGLLESSLAQVNAINQAASQGRYLTPGYQIAGMTQDQLDAIAAGQAGIGAYQPYLTRATQSYMDALGTTGKALQTLQGADTRRYFPQAMQQLTSAGTAIDQMGQAAEMTRGSRLGEAPLTGYRPNLQTFQMGPAERAQAERVSAAQMQAARTGYLPQIQAYQMSPAERVAAQQVGTPQMAAAQTGYRPDLQTFQMGPAERVQTQSFAQPGSAEAYMSPYMQSVVERQQQAAQREADIQKQTMGAQFARAGAFGGGRFGVQQARMAEALARQKGDIQAQGLQSAFQQAQAQFNQEQQARLAAQQANQQAALAIGQQNLAAQLGVQQLGTQTGLQTALANLSSAQQANVQNQAAQLQAQGMNAQQALQAALANQQAGLQVGQQNLASQQQAQQLGVQTGLQTSLANLSSEQQANVQNQAAQMQAMGMNSEQALRAALANQQAGMSVGQQNLAAQLGVQQLGSQQGLQAALADQAMRGQYGIAGTQMGLQAAQQLAGIYGQQSQLGQQLAQGIGNLAGQQFGIGQQLAQGMGTLGGQQAGLAQGIGSLGAQSQAMGQQDVNFLYNLGAQQQRQAQAVLDAQRQNALQQNMQPMQMLGFLSDIYKGAPTTQMGLVQQSQATPSPFQQIAGLGIAGVSAAAAGARAGLF